MKYWFRPARFWKWCAFYYPVSKAGWIATTVLFLLGVKIFLMIDSHSHSASDTLIAFTPWFIALACIFDLLCFRRGEYPSWWKKQHKEQL
jgi:hypothetical protein